MVGGDDVEVVRVGRDLAGERSVVESPFDRGDCRAEFDVSGNVDEGDVERSFDSLDEAFKKSTGMGALCRIKIPLDLGVTLLAAVLSGCVPEAAQLGVAPHELGAVVRDHDRGFWISG